MLQRAGFGAARTFSPSAIRLASTSAATSSKDMLLSNIASTQSGQKEFFHYTSYAMVAGIPASFLLGAPVTPIIDLACGVIIPLHAHIGMRSVLVDYVHSDSSRDAILLALAGFTVASIGGLTYFNLTDVGLTNGIKALFIKQHLA